MVIYTVGLSDSTQVVENQGDGEIDLDLLKRKLLETLEEMREELDGDGDAGPE